MPSKVPAGVCDMKRTTKALPCSGSQLHDKRGTYLFRFRFLENKLLAYYAEDMNVKGGLVVLCSIDWPSDHITRSSKAEFALAGVQACEQLDGKSPLWKEHLRSGTCSVRYTTSSQDTAGRI